MFNPDIETIKSRIRERLAATGMSANEAGRSAGLGLSYVNDILSGKSKSPVPHRLAMLANVLGCSPDWLIGNDEATGDDRTACRVAGEINGDCRDFTHAMTIARLALALCRTAGRPAAG